MSELALTPRAVCLRCEKPRVTCVCDRVPRVPNRTRVVVLQHPRERVHPVGTARLARLGLENARVEVVWDAGRVTAERPPWVSGRAGVLYPSRGARDLATVPAGERPSELVVIDGTWHTARTLHRDKTWLHALPHYRLSPTAPSRYRIRREPERDHVSTVEAIVEALRLLEPETPGLDALLAAFDSMIDEQLAFMRDRPGVPRVRTARPKASRRTPRALVEDYTRLVVAYGESARPDPRGERALVQWAAVHVASGRTFERFLVAPFGLPSARHLAHMELTEESFAGAIPLARFREDWRAFLAGCGSASVVAAWNQSTLDLLAAALAAPASRAAIKCAYRSNPHGGGSLEDVGASEGLDPVPLPFQGRAARRLGLTLAMARRLHERAVAPSSFPHGVNGSNGSGG